LFFVFFVLRFLIVGRFSDEIILFGVGLYCLCSTGLWGFDVVLLDHIGVAVRDLDVAVRFFTEIVGLKLEGYETVEEQGVKIAFLSAGNVEMELISPLSSESPVAKFLEKRGEGVHHVAFRVKNLLEVLEQFKSKGLQLIDDRPRKGAKGRMIAFVHPKSMFGVLLELCEE